MGSGGTAAAAAAGGGSKFIVERAKSGRSQCKGCSQLIANGELRIGCAPEPAENAPEEVKKFGVKWYHTKAKCLGQFRKTSKWWRENGRDASTMEGSEKLSDKELNKVDDIIESLKENHPNEKKRKDESDDNDDDSSSEPTTTATVSSSKKNKRRLNDDSDNEDDHKKRKVNSKSSKKSNNKRKYDSSEDESGGGSDGMSSSHGSDDEDDSSGSEDAHSRSKKKSATAAAATKKKTPAPKAKAKAAPKKTNTTFKFDAPVLTAEQNEQATNIMNEFSSKNLTQLKEMLKKNNQKTSGRKEELLERIAEMKVLGAMPMCPQCEKGRPRWDKESGEYTCPGSFTEGHKQDCDFSSDKLERTEWIE